ncbi:MAG: RidA family protein [Thaumarchaeota archaeon]|nr:MAG: RidA family protein [Nitrososphaerota archaeon]
MTDRQKVSSGVKFEGIVGYSRAVKIGALVFVSGTTGVDYAASSDSDVDAYSQTKRAIENISSALARVGSSLSDVVRTRVFIRPDVDWHDVARAHREAFGSVLPASTMISVGFLDPRILVEIEADAVTA